MISSFVRRACPPPESFRWTCKQNFCHSEERQNLTFSYLVEYSPLRRLMSNFPRPLSESFSLMSPRMQQQTAPDSDNAKSNSDQSHSATADSIGLRSSDSSSSFAHMSQPMNPSHRPPRPMTEIFSRQSAESKYLICVCVSLEMPMMSPRLVRDGCVVIYRYGVIHHLLPPIEMSSHRIIPFHLYHVF